MFFEKLNGAPRFRKKMAAFDYDGTLVRPKSGAILPKDVDDWTFLVPNIVDVLREWYDKGYMIVIFTNQTKMWKLGQIRNVLELVDRPLFMNAAKTKEDQKPNIAMYEHFMEQMQPKSGSIKEISLNESFFVGDALGRKGDWSDVDKVFAQRINVRYMGPEEAFDITNALTKKVVRAAFPIQLANGPEDKEVVIMVGQVGSGKSYVVDKAYRSLENYVVVESDKFKSNVKKMLAFAQLPEHHDKSIVFDGTNMTKEKRGVFVNWSDHNGYDNVRCVFVKTDFEVAKLRNQTRPEDQRVPMIAMYKLRKSFEEPEEAEGFKLTVINNE